MRAADENPWMPSERSRFIHSFEYFRGTAILFIVTGHCYAIGGWKIDTFYERLFLNFITGGTTLFVFISGFLFHHIYYPSFRYIPYLKKKFQFVILPYIFLSILALIFYWGIRSSPPHRELIFPEKSGFFFEYAYPFFYYLWSGKAMNAYWYIPFIAVIYLISPLLTRIMRLPPMLKWLIFISFYAVSHAVHRPVENMNPLHSAVYFFSVYLLGMLSSEYKEKIYSFLEKKEALLLLLVFIFAARDSFLPEDLGNSHKPFFLMGGIDDTLLQKTALCFFFMIFYRRFESSEFSFLRLTASASFSVYFLHSWVLNFFMELPGIWQYPQYGFMIFLISSLVGIFGSIGIALAVKKYAGRYSRSLIGW